MQKYVVNIQLYNPDEVDGYTYGHLHAYGNTLQEVFQNATISVLYDGVFAYSEAANSVWMHQLIAKEIVAKYSKTNTGNGSTPVAVSC